jgi:hypothetical protein
VHKLEPEMLRGKQPAVPGQDDVVLVDDDRNCEAELPDASYDFGDLLLGMSVRIRGMRTQRSYGSLSDLTGGHMGSLKPGAVHIPPYRDPISNSLTILKRSSP